MKANKLENIRISKFIGPNGCLALAKANWLNMLTFQSGNYIERKKIILLEMRDASIYQK
jgi:hypothetical protein